MRKLVEVGSPAVPDRKLVEVGSPAEADTRVAAGSQEELGPVHTPVVAAGSPGTEDRNPDTEAGSQGTVRSPDTDLHALRTNSGCML